MTANSDIDLCNQAMVLLGQQPSITSISVPNNSLAKIAAQLYDPIIMGLVGGYPWRFATGKVALTRLAEVPATVFIYYFQMPATIQGQPFIVYNSDAQDARPFKDWQIFEDKIASNQPELWVDFRAMPTVAKFPAHFKLLAVYALAANFAMPATRDQSKMDAYMRLAFGTPEEEGKGGYYRTARSIDAQGQPPQEQQDNPFIDVRG